MRKRLSTMREADEFSNRDLLLDIALKLHDQGEALARLENKVTVHLAAHSILNRILAVGLPVLASALVALYLRH